MTKIKFVTHAIAIGAAIGAAYVVKFASSAAGIALIHQYPVLAPIAAAISAVMLVYHNPTTTKAGA